MNAALRLIATGGALPGRTVTNEDLSRMVDTSDEWIRTRVGIKAVSYTHLTLPTICSV